MQTAASDHWNPNLDLGCGTLTPVRNSDLSVVYSYHRHPVFRPVKIEEKLFQSHGIVITTAGSWEYRGASAASVIGRGTVVSASQAQSYGCRHDATASDVNVVICLKPAALDEDEPPPFKTEVISFDAETPLRLCLAKEDDEEFESCVFELLNSYSKLSQGACSRPHGHLRMQRVKRFIERHVSEDLSLSSLAALVNISPFSLLRQFTSHAGLSPHNYMMRLRLEKAREMLKTTNLPVGLIGKTVGFSDQRYFARWFLKCTRLSPSAYRSHVSG
jgi:AraC-like DNA-binding protein